MKQKENPDALAKPVGKYGKEKRKRIKMDRPIIMFIVLVIVVFSIGDSCFRKQDYHNVFIAKRHLEGTYHEEKFYDVQTNSVGDIRLAYAHVEDNMYGSGVMRTHYVSCSSIEKANKLKKEFIQICKDKWKAHGDGAFQTVKETNE